MLRRRCPLLFSGLFRNTTPTKLKQKNKKPQRLSLLNKRHVSHLAETVPKPVKLSHEVYEPVEKTKLTPLVILHGLFGSKRNWQSLAKCYSRYRQVITVDLRCHGCSPQVDDLDLVAMSEDLKLLLEERGLRRATLMGHSLGGKVVMTVALTKPEVVDQLIVVDIAPAFSEGLETLNLVIPALKELQIEQDNPIHVVRQNAYKQLKEILKNESLRQFLLTNIVEKDGKYIYRVNPYIIEKNWPKILSFPEFISEQYHGRTLFVGGKDSPYIREKHLEDIFWLFPNSEIKHIEGAGHWVHADRPYDFLAVTNEFLESDES